MAHPPFLLNGWIHVQLHVFQVHKQLSLTYNKKNIVGIVLLYDMMPFGSENFFSQLQFLKQMHIHRQKLICV